jgi:Kef-type K+ transport system membrane component KefB
MRANIIRRIAVFCAALVVIPQFASAAETSGHGDPSARVVLYLAIILSAAKLGGDLAIRLGQPSVLGEVGFGMLLGNLHLIGTDVFEGIKADSTVDMLARIGVLILLFEVGLESTINQMMRVGVSAFAVATVGVLAPFALGWGVGAWLLPGESPYTHAFLGATLCATSVGITARVFNDLNKSRSNEARVILGAAVIDDVMGLVILAVVTGIITAADTGLEFSAMDAALTLVKAASFLIGSLALGYFLSRRLFSIASKLKTRGVLLAMGLSFCFVLAWLADAIELAPIVGAFAAGLILEDVHYRDFVGRGEHPLEELVAPISAFLVPVFFVLMGMRTDLNAFFQPGILVLAGALTIAAIVGKQVCGLAVMSKGIDRLTVGIGMIPRGEVGLIFANIGLGLSVGGQRIISPETFSAIVVMVMVTTMVTPPALRWSFERRLNESSK